MQISVHGKLNRLQNARILCLGIEKKFFIITLYLQKELSFSSVVEGRPAFKVCEGGRDGEGEEQGAEAVRREPASAESVQASQRVTPLPTVGQSTNLSGVNKNDRNLEQVPENRFLRSRLKNVLF